MLNQINLLPDSKQDRLKAKRTRKLVVTIATFILVAAVGIPLLLLAVRGSQVLLLNRTQGQIDERQQTIQNTENISTILTVKDHLDTLPALYERRVITSELLAFLPSAMPQEIRLSGITVDTAGSIAFEGISPTYAAVDKFYKALAQAGLQIDPNRVEPDPQTSGLFTNLVLENVSGPSGSEVTFTINASFAPELIDGGSGG